MENSTASKEVVLTQVNELLKANGLTFNDIPMVETERATAEMYRKRSHDYLGCLGKVVEDIGKYMEDDEARYKYFSSFMSDYILEVLNIHKPRTYSIVSFIVRGTIAVPEDYSRDDIERYITETSIVEDCDLDYDVENCDVSADDVEDYDTVNSVYDFD